MVLAYVWSFGTKVVVLIVLGCHNKETHDEKGGENYSLKEIYKQIDEANPCHQGITLSGGDPFLQVEANKKIALYAKKKGLDVWVYCGDTYENLMKDEEKRSLLKVCDVLIDGPFIIKERDITLPFRGSRNQRIIDLKESSLEKIVLWGEA